MTSDPVKPTPLYYPDPPDYESREALTARVFWALVMLVIVLFVCAALGFAIWYRFGLLGLATAAGIAGIVLSCAAATRR